jgi:hypothetical protein
MEQSIRLARPERFERYRLIYGHFGILSQMNFSRSRYSFTLVRNPISTILSTYNFWRTRPEEDPVTSQAKWMSFPEFVRRFAESPTIINNTYTHHFAALSREYPGEPQDSELLLATAKHNLAAFDFVGICEQFDDAVRLLCHETGWRVPDSLPHENRSVHVQSQEAIDPETMEILNKHNELDLQLYEFAKALFADRLEQMQTQPTPGSSQPERSGEKQSMVRNRFIAFPMPVAARRVAHIVSVSVQPAAREDETTVTVSYKSRESIAELIVGVLFVDGEGNALFGTNTMIEKMKLAPEPDREERIVFKFTHRFHPGTYSISAALARSDRPGFHYDWMDRATVFHIDPPPTVESRVERFAKKTLRPISNRVFASLETHLRPIESKLGLLQGTTAGVRDRVAGLHDAVGALRAAQDEFRQELLRLSQQQSEMMQSSAGLDRAHTRSSPRGSNGEPSSS